MKWTISARQEVERNPTVLSLPAPWAGHSQGPQCELALLFPAWKRQQIEHNATKAETTQSLHNLHSLNNRN